MNIIANATSPDQPVSIAVQFRRTITAAERHTEARMMAWIIGGLGLGFCAGIACSLAVARIAGVM